MTTYEFYDFSGRFLEAIETDNPEQEIGELAMTYAVDVDEIEYFEQGEND